MTNQEFSEQIGRLTHTYGDKAYPTERVGLIWRRFGNRHVRIFSAAIDNLIADNLQPPLATKIAEAVYAAAKLNPELDVDQFSEARAQLEAAQRQTSLCRKCYNFGTVRAWRKDKVDFPEEWLICDCRCGDIAARLPENKRMPKWLHYYDYYYVLDSDSAADETLAKFAHVCEMPKDQRIGELMRVMKTMHKMPEGA